LQGYHVIAHPLRGRFCAYAAPAAAWLEEETKEGLALEADLEAGEISHATKFAKHASYRKRRSR
jgi:hypothetical protein